MIKAQKRLVLTEAVTGLLKKSNCPATLTIEQCAIEMAMSMTSFRRKLTQEDTNYKLIQSKYLNELCVKDLLTNQVRIDDLVSKLGYSERATFERAFRHKFGITPSQFRELSLVGNDKNSQLNLAEIARNMPPLSGSCQQLLLEKDNGNLDTQRVADIVGKDPVFSGRVIGLASKAIYGKTPKNIHEAISRNLGISTVVNMAVLYAVKDALQTHVDPLIINQYTQAFLKAPKLFQLIRKSVDADIKFDIALTEQVLFFALLGVFLLSHKDAYKHQLMLHSMQGINNLQSLNEHINTTMEISIYSASSLMLSLWHIDASLVKKLTHLDKVSQLRAEGNQQDELVLFMLSCLYIFASGHKDYSEVEEKAVFLKVMGFSQIKEILFTAQ